MSGFQLAIRYIRPMKLVWQPMALLKGKQSALSELSDGPTEERYSVEEEEALEVSRVIA